MRKRRVCIQSVYPVEGEKSIIEAKKRKYGKTKELLHKTMTYAAALAYFLFLRRAALWACFAQVVL